MATSRVTAKVAVIEIADYSVQSPSPYLVHEGGASSFKIVWTTLTGSLQLAKGSILKNPLSSRTAPIFDQDLDGSISIPI